MIAAVLAGLGSALTLWLCRHRPHRATHPAHWRVVCGTRGSPGLRRQPAGHRHPLSPRCAQRWRAVGLSLGYRTQTHAIAAGSQRVNARPRSSLSLDGRERTAARIEAIDWSRVTHDLDAQGCAMLDGFLSAHECATLAALYSQHQLFRSRVVMGRHGFGRGEYQYFRYPLPPLVAELRTAIYPRLVSLANLWNEAMGWDVRYPAQPADFI